MKTDPKTALGQLIEFEAEASQTRSGLRHQHLTRLATQLDDNEITWRWLSDEKGRPEPGISIQHPTDPERGRLYVGTAAIATTAPYVYGDEWPIMQPVTYTLFDVLRVVAEYVQP